jgi:hypothetical protein
MGNTAIGSASTLLMLRTIAIWNRNIFVVIPLILLSLGQWGILFHGVATVHSSWVAAAGGCVVTGTAQGFIELIYLYSELFVLSCIPFAFATLGICLFFYISFFRSWCSFLDTKNALCFFDSHVV